MPASEYVPDDVSVGDQEGLAAGVPCLTAFPFFESRVQLKPAIAQLTRRTTIANHPSQNAQAPPGECCAALRRPLVIATPPIIASRSKRR